MVFTPTQPAEEPGKERFSGFAEKKGRGGAGKGKEQLGDNA